LTDAEIGEIQGIVDHIFSHLVWNISVYFGTVKHCGESSRLKKVTKNELAEYAFPVSHQKIWNMYMKETAF
jgi:A/G-specific adenine glycosylase